MWCYLSNSIIIHLSSGIIQIQHNVGNGVIVVFPKIIVFVWIILGGWNRSNRIKTLEENRGKFSQFFDCLFRFLPNFFFF